MTEPAKPEAAPAAEDAPDEPQVAPATPEPPGEPEREIRCTLCGLRACWTG